MSLTLVAVGACYLDTILSVDHYPKEDEKLRATRLEKRLGGNVPNTLQVLQEIQRSSTISVSTSLISTLPRETSLATQQIQTTLGQGIDTSHCLYRPGSIEAPSSYIIRSGSTDSRTLVNYNDVPEITAEEFEQVAVSFTGRERLVYHFEGRIPDVTTLSMDHVRRISSEAKISVEVEKPKREGLRSLASKADIVFYSKSWAQAEGYSNAEECLRAEVKCASKASHLFCTWGADGAACLETNNSRFIQVAAHAIEKVVDVVGAGDTFNAGVLFGLFAAHDWDLSQVLHFANELAGRKVAQDGFSGLAEGIIHWF